MSSHLPINCVVALWSNVGDQKVSVGLSLHVVCTQYCSKTVLALPKILCLNFKVFSTKLLWQMGVSRGPDVVLCEDALCSHITHLDIIGDM